ncbi:aliphatic sulfonate ABC transporter substrate-binding protein [Pediococcus siamensis]|uniref:aliphatic sulfonate ABC transporter substrate-binding protein n=1 Tax=Pediococcus siamensis TaxID=381829 RepID=UPI0039A0939F
MKRKIKKWLLVFLLFFTVGIATYGYQQTSASESGLKKIVVGYQKGDPIDISKARGVLAKKMKAKGYQVVFKEFQDGTALMTALKSGSINYARLGDTPPVTAQASGVKLTYIAAGSSKANGSGILVSSSSSIKSVADLKGKRVAYTKGTSSQYLLLSALKKAGLSASDIKWVNMDQSSASVAFAKGKVDAWATWDPYMAQAEVQQNAKVLTTGAGGISYNRDFLVAMSSFAKKNTAVSGYLTKYLSEDMDWANTHKTKLVKILMKSLNLSKKVVTKMVNRRSYSMGAMTTKIVKQQQAIADTFYKADLIKQEVKVAKIATVSQH